MRFAMIGLGIMILEKILLLIIVSKKIKKKKREIEMIQQSVEEDLGDEEIGSVQMDD
jgi:hypothetical protein